ncbi:MAG: chromosome segregation protein SMC [Alphaproteobacteria bacterium]|nr:chromosome segregation protein SMC [Alphaproteobacteria bacterium]
MKFTNLRLVGFKSFVEPTDFEIREGLTGIVGPNGCGKSNLLEALRWVMGATSAKALRGEGMSDVIFAGTSMRPARNWAEVILTLDNSDRSAPAEYNENEEIEVSRRIILKDDGVNSLYRINGKEVRAKDVQLLFADAATGANSPALVRQGQVAELINAKPQNRRRLLEEAAGVTGIHSRRHEAELRLRAAEQNLERLDDVISELETQKAALARQARQATRYRNISGDIRRAEAMAAYLRWRDAVEARDSAAENLREIADLIEETARAAAAASTAQAEAHEALDPLRRTEAEAAAALHRLSVARDNLDDEARRAAAELERLSEEIERLKADGAREKELLADAEEAVATLSREEENLRQREATESERLKEAAAFMAETAEEAAEVERAFSAKSAEAAEIEARRRAIAAAVDEAQRRLQKISAQIDDLTAERGRVEPTPEQAAALAAAKARFAESEEAARAAEAAFHRAGEERASAEAQEAALRIPRQKAAQSLAEITAERDALERVLTAHSDGDWPSLIQSIEVAPGYENALAAALGDDLSASVDDAAPAHWSSLGGAPVDHAAALPGAAAPLSQFVRAPATLARRLAAIGVVAEEDGAKLQLQLTPGQRLVSKSGDLWRWDGFVSRAEAKTAAAIRLEQQNRLAALASDLEAAQSRAAKAEEDHRASAEALARRQSNERDARALFADARRALDGARTALAELERAHERASSRLTAIDDALGRLTEDKAEMGRLIDDLSTEKSSLPESMSLSEDVSRLREEVAATRARASEARAAHGDLAREARMRADRLSEIGRERGVWATRGETAKARIADIESRLAQAVAAREAAADAPAAIEEKRRDLLDLIAGAERRRADAGDALAAAVAAAQDADRRAKAADQAAAEARETRARLEAQAESALARVEEAAEIAREACSAQPEELLAIAEHKDGAELPSREDVERRLERYKRERENLGGVNLRADEEMREVATRLDELAVEREDCDSAIRKLRAAIGNLNREARQRLNEAFDTVNRNFSSLFTRLFNGGQAELRMIDSEDPLEAGLEVFASPPGKKLASMSLMSGGEQALTATALIFAVFMANPAPVCVLDEVDAPLDDANVERFCRLLNEMAQETATRFIIITHHALTMSRMDRLFGVTMIERGVSQLVSVDLSKAEQLAAAE